MPRTSEAVARADAILDRLRCCRTLDQVNAVAAEIKPEVEDFAQTDPFILTDARGLVVYLRMGLREGWLPRACEAAREGQKKSEPVEGSRPVTGSNRNADIGGQAHGS